MEPQNSNKSLKRNLEAIRGNHSIDSLQKAAVLGTSHIIREVLQCEAWSLSGGDHRWFKTSTGKKRPVTRDIHIYNNNNRETKKLFVVRIIQKPQIKSMDKMRIFECDSRWYRCTPIGFQRLKKGTSLRWIFGLKTEKLFEHSPSERLNNFCS